MRKLASILSLTQTMIYETTNIFVDGTLEHYSVEETVQTVDLEFTLTDGTVIYSKAEVLHKIYKKDNYEGYKGELLVDWINMGDEAIGDLYVVIRMPKFKCIYKLLKDENDYTKIQIRDNHADRRS